MGAEHGADGDCGHGVFLFDPRGQTSPRPIGSGCYQSLQKFSENGTQRGWNNQNGTFVSVQDEAAQNQSARGDEGARRRVLRRARVDWRNYAVARDGSALARALDRDEVLAATAVAGSTVGRNRAGDLFLADLAVGCGMGEFARLAVGSRGRRAALGA
jgi:hypothetical protein